MENERIQYIRLWSPWLRVSHWIIALGTLFQIASAWGMANDATDPAFWRDWHLMVGQVMTLALALRLVLIFLPGSSHWRELLPRRSEFPAMLAMIKFYLSLARWPLPRWFAHNPLWKPVYSLVLLLLLIAAMSGLLHHGTSGAAGFHAATLHGAVATPITLFALFHVVAVFLHDLKGRGSLISAMIGGSRYVHVAERGDDARAAPGKGAVRVSLDSITTPDRPR